MSNDQSRIIARAEKLITQGKIEAALAQYENLARQSPRDLNLINKIGDLYSRLGRKKEAIAQFKKLCGVYEKDGFFPKAIALYKKILRLNPGDLASHRAIADLQAQKGLLHEARAQYIALARMYEGAGDKDRVIETYRALASLDANDIKPREVLADLLASQGRQEEAAAQYSEIGAALETQGRSDEARKIYEKAARLHGSSDLTAKLAANHVAQGDLEKGIRIVEGALKQSGENADLLVLLGDIQKQAGRADEATRALRQAINLNPTRPDLRLALARLQMENGDPPGAYGTLEPVVGGFGRDETGVGAAELLSAMLLKTPEHRGILRALSMIYPKLGERDKAVNVVERLLTLRIDDGEYEEALQLAEKLVELRPGDEAFRERLELVRRASRTVGGEGEKPLTIDDMSTDDGEFQEPVDGALTIDVAIAKAIGLPERLDLKPDDDDFITEHMTEADVFVKYGLPDRAIEQLRVVTDRYPAYVPAHLKLKEIHLEEGHREDGRDEMIAIIKAYIIAGDRPAAEDMLAELRRFDPASSQLAALSAALVPEITPQAFFEQVGAGAEPQPADRMLAGVGSAAAEKYDGQEDEELEIEFDDGESDPEEETPHAAQKGEPRPDAEVLEVSTDQDLVIEPVEDDEEISLEVSEEADAVSQAGKGSPGDPSTADGGKDSLLDLAQEIDAALAGDSTIGGGITGDEAEPEGHSLQEIVEAFKKGVEEQIDNTDYEAHYNLAIAYKEMGLIDEAVGEFQHAAKDADLLINCCSMLGMIFREKGMVPIAEKWYRKGLRSERDPDDDAILGIRYDLADMLAEADRRDEARTLFSEVYGTNSNFRDVAERIKKLG